MWCESCCISKFYIRVSALYSKFLCFFFNFSPKIFKKLGKGSRRLKVFLLLRFHIKLVGLKIHKNWAQVPRIEGLLYFFSFSPKFNFFNFLSVFFTKIVRWNHNLSLGTKLLSLNLNFGRKRILKQLTQNMKKCEFEKKGFFHYKKVK